MRKSPGLFVAAMAVSQALGCGADDEDILCGQVDDFNAEVDARLARLEGAFANGTMEKADKGLGLGGDKKFATEDVGDIALRDGFAYQCATIIGAKGEKAGVCLEGVPKKVNGSTHIADNGAKSVGLVLDGVNRWVSVTTKDSDGNPAERVGLLEDDKGCAVGSDADGGKHFYVGSCVQNCRDGVARVNKRLLGFMNDAQKRALKAGRGR